MEANKIVNLLFEIKVNSHIVHLQTDSMSEHKTLQCLYEDIEPLLDEYVERYTGITGKVISGVKNIQVKEGVKMDTYLKECAKTFEEYIENCEHKLLGSVIEDVNKLIYKTIYLLRMN